jgi:hypothetical protein
LRLRVTQVALTPLDGPPRQTRVQVLWQTQATTALVVPRPTTHARVRTPLEVVDAIATLATGRTDDAMAAVRKAQGLRSGRHQPRTPDAVAWIRYTYHLRKPGSEPPMAARLDARPDGRYSTRALAMQLGVTISTVHSWRKHGIMPAIQETPGGPWWHTVTPAVLAALRQHIRRVSLRTDDPGIPNAH